MLVRSPKSRSCAFMLDGTAVRVRLDRIHGGKGSFGAFTLDGIEFALFKQPRREAAQFGSRASVVSRVRRFGSQGGRNRPQLSVLLTIPRLRTLLRGSRCVLNRRSALSEDIGSVLKGVVKVRQRQLVNEVLKPLVTEFVRNFGREGATPIQRAFNASFLGRVQALKLIRHSAPCRDGGGPLGSSATGGSGDPTPRRRRAKQF